MCEPIIEMALAEIHTSLTSLTLSLTILTPTSTVCERNQRHPFSCQSHFLNRTCSTFLTEYTPVLSLSVRDRQTHMHTDTHPFPYTRQWRRRSEVPVEKWWIAELHCEVEMIVFPCFTFFLLKNMFLYRVLVIKFKAVIYCVCNGIIVLLSKSLLNIYVRIWFQG